MIGKHTKVLFLVAVLCIGVALSWQRYSQAMHKKSDNPPVLYNLDLRTGVMETNRPDDVPLLSRAFRVVGAFALLLAIPLLVSDITHRRQRR